MANVPLKWGIIGTDGKVEINGADDSVFSSSSPAFKVNGDGTVTGAWSVGGNGTVAGNLSVTGNGAIGGNLQVTGRIGINVSPDVALDVNGAIRIHGSELQLGTPSSSSNDSADIVFRYGNGNEKSRIWTNDTYADTYGPNYRLYNASGTQLFSGKLLTEYSGLERGDWWASNQTHNPDDLRSGIVFSYTQHGTPTTGTMAAFGCRNNGNYTLQIQGGYSTNQLWFRNRNGDGSSWGSWIRCVGKNEIGSVAAYNTLPVGNGGTGATTAAAARTNLGLGTAATYNCNSGNVASTVILRDGNGDFTTRYAYTTHVNMSAGDQTTSLDYSQYMIYCNSDGWLRKAKHMTTLYSGSLKNGTQATWANVNSYSFYLVVGTLTGNAEPLNAILVTRSMLGASQVRYQYADENQYYSFYLWYSGTTGYIKGGSGSNANAYIKWVIGLN